MHKVFCLLSGGIDSSTTLAIARQEHPHAEFEAATINYGQRHLRERDCAVFQADKYEAEHVELDAAGMLTGMLVDKGAANETIPEISYGELAPGISPTYVSFRNGFMLSMLAARAQSWIMEQEKQGMNREGFNKDEEALHQLKLGEGVTEATIYIGVHADDGVNWAYPDCTPEFIGAMANAIYIGTYNKVRLRAPLQYDSKVEVVSKGLVLEVDYAKTWSCYKGADVHCGVCPTCRSRKEAFVLNGSPDPTEYAA
jgi:7-cyano-7-deazaguanine synthase